MSRLRVGSGCRGRCAPGCDVRRPVLPLAAAGSADGFRPCEGGVLELSGVFAGSFNFSRSAAFSARNAPLSASRRDSRAVNISTCRFSAAIVSACVKTKRIRASLSSESRASRFIQSLNQRPPALSKPHLNPPRTINPEIGLSNYRPQVLDGFDLETRVE